MRRTDENAVLTGIRDYLADYLADHAESYGVEPPLMVEVGQSFAMASVAITPAVIVAGSHTRSDDPFFAHMTVTVYFALGDIEPERLEQQAKDWKDLLQDAVRDDYTLGGSCLMCSTSVDIKDTCDGQWASSAMELDVMIDLGGHVHAEE